MKEDFILEENDPSQFFLSFDLIKKFESSRRKEKK